MKVRIYRICKDNPLPSQANSGDAGWDCYAAEDVVFSPGQIKLVPLGIIAEAPEGYHFKLCIRSSMAFKRGFTVANAPGIIDHRYSGEKDQIQAILQAPSVQTGDKLGLQGSTDIIKKGERVAQLILEKNNDIEWDEQDVPNFRSESRGGFGSSGQ
jgi:dUTP pyrophosphatase